VVSASAFRKFGLFLRWNEPIRQIGLFTAGVVAVNVIFYLPAALRPTPPFGP